MSNAGEHKGITFTGDDPRTPEYHTHAEEGAFIFPIPPGLRVIGVKFRRTPDGNPAIVEALYGPEKEKIIGTYVGINFVGSAPHRGLVREGNQMDTPGEVVNQPVQGPPDPFRPKGLTVGRIVHYVDSRCRHLAAIVTDVADRDTGIVALAAFPPGSSAVNGDTDVPFDPRGEIRGSWHYPEYVE